MNILHNPPAKAIFNRTARQWQAVNGKILASYPAGIAGKTAARWHALRHNNPVIAEAAANLADLDPITHGAAEVAKLEARALSGVEIAAAGNRMKPGLDFYADYHAKYQEVARFMMEGKENSKPLNFNSYAVTIERDYLKCTCEDFKRNAPTAANGQTTCKHIAAYLIAQEAEEVKHEFEIYF